MENADTSNSGRGDKLNSTNQEPQVSYNGVEDWGKSDLFGFCCFNQEPESFLEHEFLHDLRFDVLSPQFHLTTEEIRKLGEIHYSIPDVQSKKEKQDSFPSTSFELLKSYGKGLKRVRSQITVKDRRLSTQEIMKTAAESSSQTVDVASMLDNPFRLCCSGLPDEDAEKLKLAELLFASADKIYNQQYYQAEILLECCDRLSSFTGNVVQRLVYYFSKALRERINQETGRITLLEDVEELSFVNLDEEIMVSIPTILACHTLVPFSQVAYFAGIQTITENISRAKKIHIIDLGIRTGVQWTGFMQALVSQSTCCSIELLKITAIGTTRKHLFEETGKRLERFSQSLNIPFCFKLIMVSDMIDLKENMFDLSADEEIVIYAGYLLWSLVPFPDRLDSVMKVIQNLNPNMVMVIHPELYTSGSFVKRFTEAFYYFGAFFDSLEVCMGDNPNRIVLESSYIADGIRSAVRRKRQDAKLKFLRALFARFGMEEIELGTISLCYANQIAIKLASCNSCTLEMDGKSLLIGWKGTPMKSLSAWRLFSN
ncbi:DELLA protein 1 [Euphorbia peplus]|nr:DELLA protein 1 [Euphorbia peplus]